jgi:glycerol-3-phosphate dehydrogenase
VNDQQSSPAGASAAETAPGAIDCDVLVVGGGINGCGIARDLAGRGWRVVLAEQDDLGQHTSSAASKLIHGGLRYLEYGEFKLVRKALAEREVLLRSAPHIMRSLRFVMPHDPSMRPEWMIRAGLFLYDHLAPRDWLPGTEVVNLRDHALGASLQPQYKRGFVYSDGWVDDARLVVLCALDAAERGASILPRARCMEAVRMPSGWHARLQRRDGHEVVVKARALVNAAGPWAEAFLRTYVRAADGEPLAKRQLRLVQGSHIVVPARFEHDHAYIFQGSDRRVIFAIPYEGRYTLIGTTDTELRGTPEQARVQSREVEYLCREVSRYFRRPVEPADVVWSFVGVRPLLDDAAGNPAAVTRDYFLEVQRQGAPLLTVWGGKLTTFRKLAEEAADEVGDLLGESRDAWTRTASLPGGDLSGWVDQPQQPDADLARFVSVLRQRHPWMDLPLARRWARQYGSRVRELLDGVTGRADLGQEIAPDLYEAELRYLRLVEWAQTADDVLWRRTKLGLHYNAEQRAAVGHWFDTVSAAGLRQAAHTSSEARKHLGRQ